VLHDFLIQGLATGEPFSGFTEERVLSLADWNWRLPTELQDVPWDCAAASLTWALNTIGRGVTEADVVNGLGPSRISPLYGLLDASGAGLVSYCGEIGVQAANNPNATWYDVVSAAGSQPMIFGGRYWNHWSGVRISNHPLEPERATALALANPSPGWMGVGQVMTGFDFETLGPFSAVWFTSW
jgi:hypothetical protein